MSDITVPDDDKQFIRDSKTAKLWEDYAEKVDNLTHLLMKADINTELLTEVIRATINLYKGNE